MIELNKDEIEKGVAKLIDCISDLNNHNIPTHEIMIYLVASFIQTKSDNHEEFLVMQFKFMKDFFETCEKVREHDPKFSKEN